ncbi:MAG: hypothetical protein M3N08_07500, partial [Pseudomonadota bacterium]|nr:hypothetical protein [Pseudomonadota bacterium]
MVSLAELRPKYDVRVGNFSSDTEMSIDQLLRPAIVKVSDQHIGLRNAHVANLYDMRECIIPKIVTNNGDYVDLQALERSDTFLTIEDLCLLDQSNWLQAIHGTRELHTEGNHDQKLIRAAEEARQVGLNVFPAIRIQHPAQRDKILLHGHHFDSSDMVLLPMQIAAGVYDDMVSTGADGAATAKIITKLMLDGLG